MKAREYEAWPLRNVLSGGQLYSFDEYNREYKKVRYKSAEEYASRNVKEYHHYSEYNDSYAEESKKRHFDKNSKNSHAARMRVMQQIVCLIAGSTIIVSTYQAMTKQAQATPEPTPPAASEVNEEVNPPIEETTVPVEEPTEPPVEETTVPAAAATYTAKWKWSDDFTKVSVLLYDSNGNLVSEVPATISSSVVDPTCNKEGTKTHTASATYNSKTYSDTRSETLAPLGHDFDDGKETVLDSGQSAKEFECKRCHEHFTIATSSSEND